MWQFSFDIPSLAAVAQGFSLCHRTWNHCQFDGIQQCSWSTRVRGVGGVSGLFTFAMHEVALGERGRLPRRRGIGAVWLLSCISPCWIVRVGFIKIASKQYHLSSNGRGPVWRSDCHYCCSHDKASINLHFVYKQICLPCIRNRYTKEKSHYQRNKLIIFQDLSGECYLRLFSKIWPVEL